MQNVLVVVLCNLKEKKLADYMSHGMVMCAENAERTVVEFVNPPEGSVPGDLISIEGFARTPLEVLPMKKNNDPWSKVMPCLFTDDNLQAVFRDAESGKDSAFKTDKGVCKSSTVKKGVIR